MFCFSKILHLPILLKHGLKTLFGLFFLNLFIYLGFALFILPRPENFLFIYSTFIIHQSYLNLSP